jgi:predicted metalloprotease with PDZ domain
MQMICFGRNYPVMLVKSLSIILIFQIMSAKMLANPTIEYFVSMPQPHTHYFEVEVVLRHYQGDFVDFKLPVWTPGSYLIREFAKNVEGFQAIRGTGGRAIPFFKINKNTWRVQHNSAENLTIKYAVYANDGSVRMSYLDDDHAFIMANTLLVYVDDLKKNSCVLHLDKPYKWRHISTSLNVLPGLAHSFIAPSYDVLVDCPLEIGNHEIITFEAAGIPHEIAMFGRANYDSERLKSDFTRIVDCATAIFDENPNKKYVFIVHNTDKRQGGLEHESSTVLGVNRDIYNDTYTYNNFLSLAAHEYFHLWLVKRLKPKALEPIDYDSEMYTDMLWVMEGFTSYFEEKIMFRAGFHDENQFLHNLLHALSTVQNTPGNRVQSVAESSMDAWIKAYRKDENSQNTQISYYTKGMLLGAMLDLSIIHHSKARQSLDDVVKHLYHEFYKTKRAGITNDDLKSALEKTGNINLDLFYSEYVYGTSELDFAKFLDYAGIQLIDVNEGKEINRLGATLSEENGRVIIHTVLRGGASHDSGLSPGDELISIDSYRVDMGNLQGILNQYNSHDSVSVIYSRDGLVSERKVVIRKDASVAYTHKISNNKSRQQDAVFKAWLRK